MANAIASKDNDSSPALAASGDSSLLPRLDGSAQEYKVVRVTCRQSDDESPILRQGVEELFQLYFEELRQVGCDLDFQGFQSEWIDLPGKYDFTKRGGLFVAVDTRPSDQKDEGDEPVVVGCVALRPLDESDNSCEVKRMYIRESHRRRGIGNLLAKAVIDLAWDQGYDVIKLDSLERLPAALNLYERLGFQRIPPYCFCPLDDHVCMSLTKL